MTKRAPIPVSCCKCGATIFRKNARAAYKCRPCHDNRLRRGRPNRWHRRKADPLFVVAERRRRGLRRKVAGYYIGKLLRAAMRRAGSTGVSDFLGYTPADLAAHLERQFAPGMTWARFHAGEIEIDHFRPLASFDLANADELRAAWALSNLQPLWARDNREKGARLPA